MENEPIEGAPKKSSLGYIVGGALLVILLLGAAFMAGRLLKRTTPASAGGDRGGMVVGGDGIMKEVQIEQPEELPDRPPDVTGVLARVENNSVFVTTSSGPISVRVGPDGAQVDINTESGDATTVEVVVTQETLMYRDATAMPGLGNTPPDKIERKVVPMTLDELDGQALVTAWGERKGDRLIAEVLFCSIFPETAE